MNAFAIDGRLKTQVHLSTNYEAKKITINIISRFYIVNDRY